jgi:soluble cytochrome b562
VSKYTVILAVEDQGTGIECKITLQDVTTDDIQASDYTEGLLRMINQIDSVTEKEEKT